MAPRNSLQKPKAAATAYSFFFKEFHANFLGSRLKGKLNEAASGVWESFSEADKRPYLDKEAKDKERFDEEQEQYLISLASVDPVGALKLKYQRLIPQSPPGVYYMFAQSEDEVKKATEALNKEGKPSELKHVAAKLVEMWSSLSEAEKQPYELQHQAALKEFEAQQEKWEASPEYAQLQKAQQAEDTWRNLQMDLAQGLKRTAEKDPKTPVKRQKSKKQLESVSESKTSGRPRKLQDGEEISSTETVDKRKKALEEDASCLSKQDSKISCDVTGPAPPPQDVTVVLTASSPAAEVGNQVEESKEPMEETAIDVSNKESMEQVAHMEVARNTQTDETQAASAGEENTENAKLQPAKKRARAASKKPMKKADVDVSLDPPTKTTADMKETCSSNKEETEVANAGEENQEDAKQQPAKKRAKAAPKRTVKKADVDMNGDPSTKSTKDMEKPCHSNKEESEVANACEETKQESAKKLEKVAAKKPAKKADAEENCETSTDPTTKVDNRDTEVANASEDTKQESVKKHAKAAAKKPAKKADADVNCDTSTIATTEVDNRETEAAVSEPKETSTAKLYASQERDTGASAETAVGIQPHGKQTRRRKGAKPPAALDFPEEVLSEARKIGYEPLLCNLASRPEIISNGASAAAMLEALKSSGGLVNAAKHALLSN